MKRSWLSTLAVLLLLPAAGLAQSSATTTGSASATVERMPITLTLDSPLYFGRFAPSDQAGSVFLFASHAVSTEGTNVTILSQGTPAHWSVSGSPNTPFTLVLPADRTISLSSGSSSMLTDFFFSSYNESGATPMLAADGRATFTQGAKLLVGANQPPGVYTGSYPVTVAY